MRKTIRPAKLCETCGATLKPSVEALFCDYCKEKFSDDSHVEITIFWKGERDLDRTDRQEFCSMKCCRKWLKEFPYNKERIDSITLPYVDTYNDIVSLLAFDEEA